MLFYKAILIPLKDETEFTAYRHRDDEEEHPKYNEDEVEKILGVSDYNSISSFYISEAKGMTRKAAFACNRVNFSLEKILDQMDKYIYEQTGEHYRIQNLQEITGEEYNEFYGYRRGHQFDLDYYGMDNESLIEDSHGDINLNVRDKLCLLGNEALDREIKRISSDKNAKTYVGQVVHYILETTDYDNAYDVVNILLGALYANNRLLSKRITWVHMESHRFVDDGDLIQLLRYSVGTTLVLDGYSEEEQEILLQRLQGKLAKYARNTLMVFLTSGKADELVDFYRQNGLKPVVIKDGVTSKDRAFAYLNYKVFNLPFAVKFDEDIANFLPNATSFSFASLNKSFNAYYDKLLTSKFYGAYAEDNTTKADTSKEVLVQEAYQELNDLIGLSNIKRLLRQIVTIAKYNRCRKNAGLKVTGQTLHMCFKGNPGTAKTSMARIMGKILKAEGILAKGTFVECGRGDLVAKYVGWTAKQVKKKFSEAQGGILFIDEAYSLVEDRNSFATEAINTIVQDMENHRDDVIVIFAGYKEPMEKFLDMNEGLRSRIPYQLNFPDYDAEELAKILQVMLKNQGYELVSAAEKDVRTYFTKVAQQKDFGNGRFVRNFLEKTVLKHAERVMLDGEPTAEAMTRLTDTDLAIEEDLQVIPVQKKIGFNLP